MSPKQVSFDETLVRNNRFCVNYPTHTIYSVVNDVSSEGWDPCEVCRVILTISFCMHFPLLLLSSLLCSLFRTHYFSLLQFCLLSCTNQFPVLFSQVPLKTVVPDLSSTHRFSSDPSRFTSPGGMLLSECACVPPFVNVPPRFHCASFRFFGELKLTHDPARINVCLELSPFPRLPSFSFPCPSPNLSHILRPIL